MNLFRSSELGQSVRSHSICAPSLASNGKTTCQTKKSYREPACPVQSPPFFEDVRMPKAVFFGELREGKRDRRAPGKRYKDQQKRQLARVGIDHQSWQQEARYGDSWRSSVRKASCKFETARHEAAKERLRGQKERAAFLSFFAYPKCASAVGSVHQESDSKATSEHAKN